MLDLNEVVLEFICTDVKQMKPTINMPNILTPE